MSLCLVKGHLVIQCHWVCPFAQDVEKEQLDTTISGPWMKQWRIVHGNKYAYPQIKSYPTLTRTHARTQGGGAGGGGTYTPS